MAGTSRDISSVMTNASNNYNTRLHWSVRIKTRIRTKVTYSLFNKSESSIFRKLLDFKTFFFLNKSTLEGLRRYYLIDGPVPIVVQNGLAPFRHAFH